mmetsp:Transcript_1143/g.2916  ORF Transcript_1143/g.2916 Transcript_1143/m.2916 type:complete len:264 (+) Transcript_1143:354-1145(+)
MVPPLFGNLFHFPDITTVRSVGMVHLAGPHGHSVLICTRDLFFPWGKVASAGHGNQGPRSVLQRPPPPTVVEASTLRNLLGFLRFLPSGLIIFTKTAWRIEIESYSLRTLFLVKVRLIMLFDDLENPMRSAPAVLHVPWCGIHRKGLPGLVCAALPGSARGYFVRLLRRRNGVHSPVEQLWGVGYLSIAVACFLLFGTPIRPWTDGDLLCEEHGRLAGGHCSCPVARTSAPGLLIGAGYTGSQDFASGLAPRERHVPSLCLGL